MIKAINVIKVDLICVTLMLARFLFIKKKFVVTFESNKHIENLFFHLLHSIVEINQVLDDI